MRLVGKGNIDGGGSAKERAEQSSNIITFRQCMELCHEDPKTKDLAEKYMKELDE